jgi:1-acyl-sn-glycerol-3-phosphate acyltransferase
MREGAVKRDLRYWFGWLYLKLAGWTMEGEAPQLKKFVLICAPHTSNWDLPLMLSFSYLSGVRLSWLGKKSIFKGPIRSRLFGWLGGVSVDRKAPQGLVDQVAAVFDENQSLVVAVPPAGTRGRTEGWKTGFYFIAVRAQVPISLGFLDYSRKRGGFGPAFVPTGDIDADFGVFREFYHDKHGRFPDLGSQVELIRSRTRSATDK